MSGGSTTRCSFLNFFQRPLICVLLSWPSNTRVVPVSVPSRFIFVDSLYVYYYHEPISHDPYLYQRSRYHFLYLYVSHYHDPVTHEYYMYQRPVVLFLGTTYMCIIILAHQHSSTTRIIAQSFFPMTNNLHVYNYCHPVTDKYIRV
jgi:hypothetical protein